MKSLIMASLLFAFGVAAEARPAAPLWTCQMHAKVQNHSVSVIVGIVDIRGKGKMDCVTALGQTVSKPIALKVVGLSFGPDISFPDGEGNLNVISAAIGISDLDAIYGEYSFAGNLTLQVGDDSVGVSRDFLQFTPNEIPNGGISTGVALSFDRGGQIGLGVNASVTGMSIRRL